MHRFARAVSRTSRVASPVAATVAATVKTTAAVSSSVSAVVAAAPCAAYSSAAAARARSATATTNISSLLSPLATIPSASLSTTASAAASASADVSVSSTSSLLAARSRRFMRRAALRRHAFALHSFATANSSAASTATATASAAFFTSSPFSTAAAAAAPSASADATAAAAAAVSAATGASAHGVVETEFDALTLARRWSELNTRGMELLQLGTAPDLDAAERCFREAALVTAHIATTTPYRALAMANLGSCLTRKGRCDDALHIFLPLLPELKRHQSVSPAQVAMVHMECATAYELTGALAPAAAEIDAAAAVFITAVSRASAGIKAITDDAAAARGLSTANGANATLPLAPADSERAAQLVSDALTAFRTSLGCRFRGAVLLHRQRQWANARAALVAIALEYRSLIDILATQHANPGRALAVTLPLASALNSPTQTHGAAPGFLTGLYLLPADALKETLDATAVDLVNVMLALASVHVDLFQVPGACATYEEVAKFALVHSPQNFMGVMSEASKTLRAVAQVALPKNARAPKASETYVQVLKEAYKAEAQALAGSGTVTDANLMSIMGLDRNTRFVEPESPLNSAEAVADAAAALHAQHRVKFGAAVVDDADEVDLVAQAVKEAEAEKEKEEEEDVLVFRKKGKRGSSAAEERDASMRQLFTQQQQQSPQEQQQQQQPADAAGKGALGGQGITSARDVGVDNEDVVSTLMGSELADLVPMMSTQAVASAAAAVKVLRRVDATRAFFGKLFAEHAKKEAAARDAAMAGNDERLGELPEEVRRAIEEQARLFRDAMKEGEAAAAVEAAAAAEAEAAKNKTKQ